MPFDKGQFKDARARAKKTSGKVKRRKGKNGKGKLAPPFKKGGGRRKLK